MNLRILLPSRIALDQPVAKVSAEGEHGSFTLLENHVDTVILLEPGLLWYDDDEGEHFWAVDRGVMVKRGREVRAATSRAIPGPLDELRSAVNQWYASREQEELEAQQALEKLEADFVRQFVELEVRG